MDKRTLNLKYVNSYMKNGKRIFTYTVNSLKPEDLDAYKEMKGDFYREDEDGKPLYFTTRRAGNNAKLVLNVDTDKMYVDNTELDIAISQAESIGGVVGQAMATEIAKKLLGKGFSNASVAAPTKAPVVDETAANLDA